jgi:hypothetical protein
MHAMPPLHPISHLVSVQRRVLRQLKSCNAKTLLNLEWVQKRLPKLKTGVAIIQTRAHVLFGLFLNPRRHKTLVLVCNQVRSQGCTDWQGQLVPMASPGQWLRCGLRYPFSPCGYCQRAGNPGAASRPSTLASRLHRRIRSRLWLDASPSCEQRDPEVHFSLKTSKRLGLRHHLHPIPSWGGAQSGAVSAENLRRAPLPARRGRRQNPGLQSESESGFLFCILRSVGGGGALYLGGELPYKFYYY